MLPPSYSSSSSRDLWPCARRQCAARVCRLADIKISVKKTGRLVEGQSEYKVTIAIQCSYPQGSIYVRCLGLPSVEPVDATRIRPVDGQHCLVAGGRQIPRGTLLTFTYAWKTPQDFTVLSAQPHC